MDETPKLKKAVLTEKITMAVDADFKQTWENLKVQGIDAPEWARRILRRELVKLGEMSAFQSSP